MVGGANYENPFDVVRLGDVLVAPSGSWSAIIVPSMRANNGLNLLGVELFFGFGEVGVELGTELVG